MDGPYTLYETLITLGLPVLSGRWTGGGLFTSLKTVTRLRKESSRDSDKKARSGVRVLVFGPQDLERQVYSSTPLILPGI